MGNKTPLPVSETLMLEVSGSSESIVRDPLNVPVDDGLNVTETVQLPSVSIVGVMLAHGVEPPFSFKEKFVVSDRVMSEMLRSASPVLDMVTSKGVDELPTVTSPKFWLVGETEIFG